MKVREALLFAAVAACLLAAGFIQSWNVALVVFNMGLVSAVLALGVNMQWGYAGLFNVGVMGFVALGGLATVLISTPPVYGAWAAGGLRLLLGLAFGSATMLGAVVIWRLLPRSPLRAACIAAELIVGFAIYRWIFDPAVKAIEGFNAVESGFLGGFGLPVLLAWPAGAALAAGAAYLVGKVALGLRSDYLAIATLGISEIIIAILKNEEWLARGVKNVAGLPRPVPYEIDLQNNPSFAGFMNTHGFDVVTASSITVKLCYSGIFLAVLLVLYWLAQRALNSPWGRMIRAIRENETAAEAMGKDVTRRHLQVFVLGSAVCGLAGAMMTTLDGQLTPTSYQPLRYTFLVWVMVIVGGSGNNLGSIIGAFLIWFLWIEVEPIGRLLIDLGTIWMGEGSMLRTHLIESAAHMRLLTMGVILLVVLRFSPRGLIPEK